MVELVPTLLRQELASRRGGQRMDGRGQWKGFDVSLKLIAFTMLKVQPKSFWVKPSSMLELNLNFVHHGQTALLKAR